MGNSSQPEMSLLGRKVIAVRPLEDQEVEDIFGEPPGRHGAPLAIVLEGDIQIVASQDPEGNGPGAFFMFTEGEFKRLTEPEGSIFLKD